MINLRLTDNKFFILSVLIFTGLGLAVIWIPRFPAMQDYPQHLFMAYVLSEYNNPAFNWNQLYDVNGLWGPNNLFYLIVSALAVLIPIEIAGKIFISLSLILTTVFVLGWNHFRSTDYPPWSLLLLFPFFFSQIYYLGFTNYLISIPLLFLLLLNHLILVEEKPNFITGTTYFFLAAFLFLSHPYTILVYIVLSLTISLSCRQTRHKLIISIIPPVITIALFIAWFIFTFDNSALLTADGLRIGWWPGIGTVGYFILPFVGMNVTGHIDYLTLVLWIVCVSLFTLAILRRNRREEFNLLYLRLFLLTFLGYVSLPFWLGDFSYFNVRMSILCYFFLAIVLSGIKLPRFSIFVLFFVLCCLMLITFKNHQSLSCETEELLPLLSHMQKNSSVCPIYLDATPGSMDKVYFYQFHEHDHVYYNIIVGGGAPKLYVDQIKPIVLKHNSELPRLSLKPEFYQYVLLRTNDPRAKFHFKKHHFKMESKSWRLYENDNVRKE